MKWIKKKADKTVGKKFCTYNYDIHVGAIAGLPGKVIAFFYVHVCGWFAHYGLYDLVGAAAEGNRGGWCSHCWGSVPFNIYHSCPGPFTKDVFKGLNASNFMKLVKIICNSTANNLY
ncbi:MAG: hypothetical protein AAGI38_19920 [Bacteroidota bacterium]